MKSLFPAQQQSAAKILNSLSLHGAALDSSQTGTGKTVVASHVATKFLHVGVVCPKIVIPHWEEELADAGITPLFILNYEKVRTGRNGFVTKRGKKTYRWDQLPSGVKPENTLLIWDECHKAKGPYTQNAQLLIAAKEAGFNLLLSATPFESPTEMRAIGYVLGLHSLNMTRGRKDSWNRWMIKYGCRKNPWGGWERGPLAKLKKLHEELYQQKATRLTIADMPEAFQKNLVFTERLKLDSKAIDQAFADIGISDEELVDRLCNIGVDDKPSLEVNVLTQILRARQITEREKIPAMVEIVEESMREGFSTVVFVNFRDTAQALVTKFPHASIVIGGQKADERALEVENFQTNKTNLIVVMTSAGGTGVNLHDKLGGHTRMCIHSPVYNLKEHVQALGRGHRAGAKTPTIQRILVANDTIEEKIIDALEKKRLAHSTIHES